MSTYSSGPTVLTRNSTIPQFQSQGRMVKANHATLVAWLTLNVWPSHIGLPVLVSVILLSRTIRRHATFINMCITWIIVGLSSSLLLYAGDTTGPEPPRALCLIQASLLYGQPGMTSLSAFALVYQVFHVVRTTFQEKDHQKNQVLRKWLLLIAPYVAFVIFASVTAYIGGTEPFRLSRSRRVFYCSVRQSLLTNTITAFSAFVLLATLSLELWIAFLCYKHWRVLRQNELTEGHGMDLNLIIRTAVFGMAIFLGMSLSLLSMKAPSSPVPDLALATMGSIVVLIFGTQKDILRALVCFRREDDGLRRLDLPSSPKGFYSDDLKKKKKKSWLRVPSWSRGKSRKELMMSSISHPIQQNDQVFVAAYGQAI
ncbi:hypothetical protein BD410DRAFT_780299 [Rickenella mellea]|uniref:G-protein coupled receptors family 1 profile domain-containing protein n=1 Tax=Rickenella mellea TaxID=50990 RepID=A0A4R5XH98_9AGAM|nr:hypothetical protein BD410DRAFT_780299 [Rickenella mellea]